MIAHLRGTIVEKHPNQVIVECAGVGYDVTIPVSSFSRIDDVGREARLHIHTHVREDALALFGFATREEKSLFERLISVSGIGPKLAITVLSGLAAPELAAHIRNGDIAALTRISGVGKKTAERMVVELRDKLELLPGAEPRKAAPTLSPLDEDVVSALLNLGSQRAHAEAALASAKAKGATDFEGLFRAALEALRKR